jgi:hypothetical protein
VPRPATTYYTVSDERYFVGTVGLLNSLRLTGNDGELVILDRGLAAWQKGLLAPHATVVDLPELRDIHYWLLKGAPALVPRPGLAVLIDSDIIVTMSLDDILDVSAGGAIYSYPDHHLARERWFPEWSDAFGLTAPLRRGQTYVNVGFVAFSQDHWPRLFERVREVCERVPASEVHVGRSFQPFWAGDQDAMNALFMSEIPAESMVVGPSHEAVYWDAHRDVEIVDPITLSCVYDQWDVRLLHAASRPKPWLGDFWRRVRMDDAYVRLLRRLLFDPEAPVTISPDKTVFWLRPDPASRFTAKLLSLFDDTASFALRAYVRPLRNVVRRRVPSAAAAGGDGQRHR